MRVFVFDFHVLCYQAAGDMIFPFYCLSGTLSRERPTGFRLLRLFLQQ